MHPIDEEEEREFMDEFNELVDEWLCGLWEQGLEVGHDGQLCRIDTPWAMGLESEQQQEE